MTRQEAYSKIVNRMRSPINSERYKNINENCDTCTEDTLIDMYLRHIHDYLKILEKTDDPLVATSCDAAIKKVNELLDLRGWAK